MEIKKAAIENLYLNYLIVNGAMYKDDSHSAEERDALSHAKRRLRPRSADSVARRCFMLGVAPTFLVLYRRCCYFILEKRMKAVIVVLIAFHAKLVLCSECECSYNFSCEEDGTCYTECTEATKYVAYPAGYKCGVNIKGNLVCLPDSCPGCTHSSSAIIKENATRHAPPKIRKSHA